MERNIALDILKLCMSFMIIGLHAGFLGDFNSLASYLSVNGVFRVAVPVFLIINGFYFRPVLDSNKQFLWIKRVFILYIVWMLFYSYFWFSLPDISLLGLLGFAIKVIIGYHHLWYVSGMLGAAILLLIFRRLPTPWLTVFAMIMFFIGVLVQYLGNYHYFEGTILDKLFNINWFHRNMLFFSFPFFVIGYLISKYSVHKSINLKTAGLLSVAGFLVLLAESYINFNLLGKEGSFDNFLSLLIVCPMFFIFFIKLRIPGETKKIALYSSSVYFIHSFILTVMKNITELDETALTCYTILISLLFSYFIIKLNQRVKFIL